MRSLIRGSLLIVLIGLGGSLVLSSPMAVQSRPQATHSLYADALENGWADYGSWDVTANYGNAAPVHGGTASIQSRLGSGTTVTLAFPAPPR